MKQCPFMASIDARTRRCEHRGDSTQEADLVCWICAAHGGYKTSEFRMFVELVGDAGCVGDQKKEWMGCFLDDPRAFGINADQ